MNNRKVFAELLIKEAPACHITLVSASGLNEQKAQIVQLEVEKRLSSMMPLHIQLGNYCMVGNSGEIPAYECKAVQTFIHELLCNIYSEHWRPIPGKRCYPQLKMHVTVDTPEKVAQIEEIFRVSPDYTFEASRFNIGSRIMEQDMVVAVQQAQPVPNRAPPIEVPIPSWVRARESPPVAVAPMPQYNPASYHAPPASAPPASDHGLPVSTTPNTWLCGSCNRVNSMTIKECGTGSCSEWRPMPKRNGDWKCCGELQFASRAICRKCGKGKKAKY